MFTKSIRWRIQLWVAFLLLCVLTGFGVTVHQLYRLSYFDQLDEELSRAVAGLNADIRGPGPGGRGGGPRKPPPFDGPPPFERPGGKPAPFVDGDGPRRRHDFFFRDGPEGGPRRTIRLSPNTASMFDESRTNGLYFAVWSRSGSIMRLSSNAPPNLVWPESARKDTQPHTFTRGSFRETHQFTELGECVLAGRWVGDDLKRLDRFSWIIFAAGAAIMALGLGGSWSLAREAVRPVEKISATASRISAGNLSERINVSETDGELGRLAGVLNSTFSRLETSFAHQRQFTADASHELRTPLAVMISEAQTTLARPRSAEEYRETVEACLDAAQEMRRLTDSMLQLARLDVAQQTIEREPTDLADLAKRALEMVQPLADARGVQFKAQFASSQLLGDPGLLTQVIVNLLNNAIHHNRPSGSIELSTHTDSAHSVLIVADTGVGISPDDLPHIFERFYRGDKARSSGGRMGLGLAICKTIVDLHNGKITVESERGKGTVFRIMFHPAG